MPEFTFNGPDGRLQGHYTQGRGANAPIALVLHPHPQHGGTMNNRVVFEIFQVFARRGFSTLRFNFRGVGRSQGSYDEGLGELSDAAAALDWLQANNPDAEQCWIGGGAVGLPRVVRHRGDAERRRWDPGRRVERRCRRESVRCRVRRRQLHCIVQWLR